LWSCPISLSRKSSYKTSEGRWGENGGEGGVVEKGENSEENDRGGVVKKKRYDILNVGKEVRGGLRGGFEKYEFKV
jgi:hypothetical protein